MRGLILDTDATVKEASDDLLIALLLLRHSALVNAAQDDPYRHVYEAARDSAEAELKRRLVLSRENV